jgi:hypothetical protein
LRAFDQDGNIASTSQNLEVTATVTGTGGSLTGTNTATFVAGVASFNNLALVGLPGEAYTISYAVAGIPVVTQNPVYVNLLPNLALSYQDTVYSPAGTVSATITSQSNAALMFSVAQSSQNICAVNSSTGEVTVLGAGTCLINLAQSLSSVVVGGETRGAWLARSTQASFQIAKANQAAVTSAVSGSSTISQAAGSRFSEVFQVTVPFGTPVELAFGGGSVTSSALTYELTTSPVLAADNQLIQPCIRVADTVFPGNVQRTSIGAVAACRVLVTKLGDANYNSVTTALDIVVVPTNQAALNMVSNPRVEFNSSQRLFASGGNGTGAVSFRLVSGATVCEIDDSVAGAPRVLGIDSGTCEISATKASSNNFNQVQSQTQTFTVVRAQQFLRFTSTIPQAPKVFGSPGALAVNYEYTPRAVASSALNPVLSVLAETDSSGSAIVSACEYDGTKVTFIAPGRCVLVATQAGSSRYLQAQSISQVIEVGRLNQTIDFDVIEDREFGDTAFQITASSNAGLQVRFTQAVGFSTLSCTVTPEGLVTLGQAGVCEIFAQQPGNSTYLQAPPVKQRFMVNPKPAAKPFVTSVAAANQAVLLSFREPSFRGGAPITAYEVIATKVADTSSQVISYGCLPLPVEAQQFDASGSPIVQAQGEVSCRIDGLENDSQYILTVAAITAYGAGEVSTPTAPVTPAPNYSAPQQLSAISDNQNATLNWTTPLEIQGNFTKFSIFVRSVGSAEFTPLPSVSSFSATSSAIPLGLLPPPAPPVVPSASPSVSPSVSATVSSMVQSPVAFRSMFMSLPRNNMFAPMLMSAPVVQRAALFSVPSPAQQQGQLGTNYEFMIITVTDQVSTSNSINTAMVQQQLLTAPAAPSTISAEPTGRDMFIAWGGSVFDGGSNIIDYVVTVNGQTVATSATPSSTIFANWQYSTTYQVQVKARNSIGLSPATTFTLTTPADPTPPVVITESSEVREMILRLPQMISFNPKIAQPGSVVTVAGEKLDKLKTVKLGSRNVEFVVFGPNRLDIKVPMDMAAGLYSVEHFSEWGRVVVQDALTIAGSPVNEDLPPVDPGKTDSPAVDPEDIDGDGTGTNEDSDIDGDGSVNGSDSDIDGDTIDNGRDPNPVVPNDPSEALPGPGENTGNEESTDSETANPGNGGGLMETNPLAAWILILIIALAGAIGAAPAIARARRKKREEEELELQ